MNKFRKPHLPRQQPLHERLLAPLLGRNELRGQVDGFVPAAEDWQSCAVRIRVEAERGML